MLRFGSAWLAGLLFVFLLMNAVRVHSIGPAACAISRKRRCTVVSAVSSGWNAAAMTFPFCTSAGLPAYFGEDFDAFADALDDRGADENHFERLVVQRGLPGDDVAVHLAAVAVAQDGHVEQAERILLRIFYSEASRIAPAQVPKTGAVSAANLRDRFVEAFFLQKLELRGAFAAGKDQAVAAFEVGGCADFHGVDAEVGEHSRVGGEVTLYRENPDFQSSSRARGNMLSRLAHMLCAGNHSRLNPAIWETIAATGLEQIEVA